MFDFMGGMLRGMLDLMGGMFEGMLLRDAWGDDWIDQMICTSKVHIISMPGWFSYISFSFDGG